MKWNWRPLLLWEDLKTFGCIGKKYSFVIGVDKSERWTASWEDHSVSPTHSVRLDGSPFKTRAQAEAACRRTLKELENKH